MVDIEDSNYFLGEGDFTQRQEETQTACANLGCLKDISQFLRGFEHTGFDVEMFRKRTAEQILKSRMVTGCTDLGLAFAALARESGIPTRYVETINMRWSQRERSVEGHVFCDVFTDGKWQIVDPLRGILQEYSTREAHYRELGKGLDFSGLYLLKMDFKYADKPTKVVSARMIDVIAMER